MATALRIAGLVVVAVGVPVIIDGSTASWIAMLVRTVVVGALIGRWWALPAAIGIGSSPGGRAHGATTGRPRLLRAESCSA